MCHLISSSYQPYQTSTSVKIADRCYQGINSVDTKNLVDNDGKTKSVSYLEGNYSIHAAYAEGDKITRSVEYYYHPQTIKLGDKLYKNVVSKTTIPNKYDVYSINSDSGVTNTVRVRKNGAVQDFNEIQKRVLNRKITKPIKNALKKVMSILL